MTKRILWNPGRETVDEIVYENCTVHIEQMSDSSYWLSITAADGTSVDGDIGSRTGRAAVDFTIMEDSIVWDEDSEHE